MSTEQADARERIVFTIQALASLIEHITLNDTLTVECYSADGALVWREQTERGEAHAPRIG
jgi:hypothetical protein